MHYLAFDVSKSKLDGVLTNLRTKTEYFSIPNEPSAIVDWFARTTLPRRVCVGCESTGAYHLALARAAIAHGLQFKILNPVLTKQFTRATVRKAKTDTTDTLIIAKLFAQGNGTLFHPDPARDSAKVETRIIARMKGMRQAAALMRKSIDLQASATSLVTLGERLRESENALDRVIHAHEQELFARLENEPEVALLRSITGIGPSIAATVWAELGDITRFESAKQIVAFAGLDPKIRQSGHTLNSYGKLTKRGSPHMRRAVFLAASVARRWDPELKDYYEKKRKEGKCYTVATVATARKVVSRIYAVLRRGTPFIPRSEFDER
jgi:transposase